MGCHAVCTAWVLPVLRAVAEEQDLREFCEIVLTSKPLSAQCRRSLCRRALKYGDCQWHCPPEWGQVEPSKVYEVSRSTWVGCCSLGFEPRLLAVCLEAAGA